MKDYKNLKVWQKAYEVSLSIFDKVDNISKKSLALDVMTKQIIRSSTSICANIAEGYGSDSNKEFARYLGIAYKSALETDSWIQLLKGYLKKERNSLNSIEKSNLETIKMLITLKKKVQKSSRKKRFEKVFMT